MRRALFAFVLGGALVLGGPRVARAGVCDTEDAGACDPSAYCALEDGGAISDGAPGTCVAEPCLTAGDCDDAAAPICDTSKNPFRCVECISTSDCPGILYCDPVTRTCITQPPFPEAGTGPEDGGVEDAGEDASVDAAVDATTTADGAAPTGGSDASAPTKDAGVDATTGTTTGPTGEDAGAAVEAGAVSEDGSIGGGAFDCAMGRPASAPFAAIGVLVGLAALRRRRLRTARRS